MIGCALSPHVTSLTVATHPLLTVAAPERHVDVIAQLTRCRRCDKIEQRFTVSSLMTRTDISCIILEIIVIENTFSDFHKHTHENPGCKTIIFTFVYAAHAAESLAYSLECAVVRSCLRQRIYELL